MKPKPRAGILLVLITLVATMAHAQSGNSGIAGVVRETSGAVLPGVTVEAASPALIEKVRSVTTGEDGSYRVLDLRPGTYSVTFSLAGLPHDSAQRDRFTRVVHRYRVD